MISDPEEPMRISASEGRLIQRMLDRGINFYVTNEAGTCDLVELEQIKRFLYDPNEFESRQLMAEKEYLNRIAKKEDPQKRRESHWRLAVREATDSRINDLRRIAPLGWSDKVSAALRTLLIPRYTRRQLANLEEEIVVDDVVDILTREMGVRLLPRTFGDPSKRNTPNYGAHKTQYAHWVIQNIRSLSPFLKRSMRLPVLFASQDKE